MSKYIFVTGGVVSSLGKGITASSIGLLLKSRKIRVAHQKFDPYLNVDPGTMNPYQHGEVYVTDDGTETDLDLGHYERFTGITANRNCNFTAGKIYDAIIKKERRGEYLGGTVQVVPHVTNEICECIKSLESPEVDVIISEIGGTVGDIESLPFLEALRQFRLERGRSNVLFVHVTLIPYLHKAGEVKTKPTQHSVGRLREIGIVPDMLICRTEKRLEKSVRQKISLFCNVDTDMVVEAFDVAHTIYEVPLEFAGQNIDYSIIDALGLNPNRRNLKSWREYVDRVINPEHDVTIAIVGKYAELVDSYKSIHEALFHAGAHHLAHVTIKSISSERFEDMDDDAVAEMLRDADGILVPHGFGARGHEGKIRTIRYARENRIPFLGICFGMQMAVVEFARHVLGLDGADSTELVPDTPHPVIHLMEKQKKIMNLGGTMRLGSFPCTLVKDTLTRTVYGREHIDERHRHRYEFNSDYRERFEEAGMRLSGLSPDGMLAEICEIPEHPWFIASQFHPEFKSRPIAPHPLFKGFLEASLKKDAS
jgi:CTP synthase